MPPAQATQPAKHVQPAPGVLDLNTLILEHLDRVGVVAGLLRQKLPPTIEWAELAQVGVVAMLEAAPRWDPQASPFWTFMYLRVRGAMLDFAAGFSLRVASPREVESIPGPDASARISMRIDIDRAMKRLSRRQRWILARIEHGDQARQIAATLHITESAVSQIRKRIRELLRAEFVA